MRINEVVYLCSWVYLTCSVFGGDDDDNDIAWHVTRKKVQVQEGAEEEELI